MNILYDVKKKTIRELKEGSEEIKLTKLENRLITLLSNGSVSTWNEIGLFVYNTYVDKSLMNNINCLINPMICTVCSGAST